MPEGVKVTPLCTCVGLTFVPKIWSKCPFGQAAFSAKSYCSRRFLTGGSSFLETSFSFPLLTVLRAQLLFYDHQGLPDAIAY